MNQELFLSSELLQLLEEDIDDRWKLELLKYEINPISIRNKKYSATVQEYIIKNLYCDEDLDYLVQWYPLNRELLRDMIVNIAVNSIEAILRLDCLLHIDLLKNLFRSNLLSLEIKERLLAKQIKTGLDKAVAKTVFDQFGLIEYQQLLDGKRPKIPVSDIHESLLNALLNREWISSYEIDKENPNYFQAYGKVKRKKIIVIPKNTVT